MQVFSAKPLTRLLDIHPEAVACAGDFMKDALYHFFVGTLDLFLWSGELISEENLPHGGPAVFIANHLDAAGPIATGCSLPLRIHPWIIANMMDKDLAPAWLEEDFTQRQLHLKPPLSTWLAKALCRIAVPLFYSLGCIPVYRGDYDLLQEKTLPMSLDVLRKEQFLLVFPEDNRMATDPVTKMQPFQRTFVRLGEMYYHETGKRLEFFPLCIHGSGYLMIGKPVAFNPLNSVGLERRRLKDLMESSIISMYLQLEHGETSGVLTPVRK
jgi:hypothetical protein